MFHILEMPFVILHEAIAPWVNRINRHRVNWSTPFARWDSSGVNPKPGLARYRFFGLRRPHGMKNALEGPAECLKVTSSEGQHKCHGPVAGAGQPSRRAFARRVFCAAILAAGFVA
ncbi:hypothetical protein [Beijerinckia mobilis]|uniref:hypothetical protein n=1 Tax=Beijerinckia mobilis TaxID=231434 RepID=UPI000556D019|nr:hypothetical protein [Beijerinckia mobilis]